MGRPQTTRPTGRVVRGLPTLELLLDAEVHAPEPLGKRHVLVGGGKILWLGADEPELPDELGAVVRELDGARLIPGLIDAHAHITGGGGEAGYSSRVPPLALSRFTRGGITSVVGLLGTDDCVRTTAMLVAQAHALCEEGLSAWCWTGGYHLPPTTLTGSVRGDIVHIERVIGFGELAISDARSSQPTLDEFLRLASECHVGGLMTGKAGVLHVHAGDGERGLALLREALASSVRRGRNGERPAEPPSTAFLPELGDACRCRAQRRPNCEASRSETRPRKFLPRGFPRSAGATRAGVASISTSRPRTRETAMPQPRHASLSLRTQLSGLVNAMPSCDPTDHFAAMRLSQQLAALRTQLEKDQVNDLAAVCGVALRIAELVSREGQIGTKAAFELIDGALADICRALGVARPASGPPAAASGEPAPALAAASPGRTDATRLKMISSRKLGELMVQLSMLTPAQVEQALAHQRMTGCRFGEALIQMRVLSRDVVEGALRIQGVRRSNNDDPWQVR